MRNRNRLFLLSLGSVLFLSCAELNETFVAVAPKVSSPFLTETLGVSSPGWLTIMNSTIFEAEIIIYQRVVIKLKPGESVADTRRWEPLINEGVEVPVLVRFYSDNHYIGAAGRIFRRYPSSHFSWNLSVREITPITPKPFYYDYDNNRSLNSYSLNSYFAKFPRELANGTTVIQILNNTPYEILVRTNGIPQGGILSQSEILYQKFVNFSSGWYSSQQISVVVVDANSPSRFLERSFWTCSRGVCAFQWIVDHLK